MSSLAQEESRSISLNVTWGQRKRFADGKATVPFGRFLGYDRGENGELVINEEEADTVRIIYAEFLAGLSYTAIAKKLTELGIKSPPRKRRLEQQHGQVHFIETQYLRFATNTSFHPPVLAEEGEAFRGG